MQQVQQVRVGEQVGSRRRQDRAPAWHGVPEGRAASHGDGSSATADGREDLRQEPDRHGPHGTDQRPRIGAHEVRRGPAPSGRLVSPEATKVATNRGSVASASWTSFLLPIK